MRLAALERASARFEWQPQGVSPRVAGQNAPENPGQARSAADDCPRC
jgi:hypothetical protein